MAIAISAFVFLNSAPSVIANTIRLVIPVLLIAFGIIGIYVGRIAYGSIPLILGIVLLIANWPALTRRRTNPPLRPLIRSVSLELIIDPKANLIDGTVLTGKWEGASLSQLDQSNLLELMKEVQTDPESISLLEAYLDCRFPIWREDAQTDIDTGLGATERSGPMTEQEAHQVLGLRAGASSKNITASYNRLLKMLTASAGGSKFLISCINQAKDTLLD